MAKEKNEKLGGSINSFVSVDCVIFGYDMNELKVMLVERLASPNELPGVKYNNMALPGNLIEDDEDLDDAANRVLKELTSISNLRPEQFRIFGNPDRLKNPNDIPWLKSTRQFPNTRVITVAYYSLINLKNYELEPSSLVKRVLWVPVKEVPPLAFDHDEILTCALRELRIRLQLAPTGLELLPKKFTLGELQNLYEVILGRELDKRNFRRKILSQNVLIPLNEKQQGVRHKPAQFFEFDPKRYFELKENQNLF